MRLADHCELYANTDVPAGYVLEEWQPHLGVWNQETAAGMFGLGEGIVNLLLRIRPDDPDLLCHCLGFSAELGNLEMNYDAVKNNCTIRAL